MCIGAATLDTIAAVSHPPGSDERVEATDVAVAGGGPAATAAVALTRLGVGCFFVGRVGDDEAGAVIREGLAREGVDVSELAVVPGGRSARSNVLVETTSGARSIAAFPGVLPPLGLSRRAGELCRSAAWVHADHVGYAAGRAFSPLSVDAGNPIEGLDLTAVALFAPTESSLAALYPRSALHEAIDGVLAAGVEIVVVTRGARGSVAAARGGTLVSAGAFPTEIRSTLGAGDVFHGAVLAALLDGRSLHEALVRANAAAALSCRGLDGRSLIPTAAELEAELAAANETPRGR